MATTHPRAYDHSVSARLMVWLSIIGASLLLFSPVHADRERHVVINAVIDMTCFPPPPQEAGAEPGIGSAPPCPVPAVDDRFISPNPSGRAYVMLRDDDTAPIAIHLQGLAPDLVITAWLAYFFPPGTQALPPSFDRSVRAYDSGEIPRICRSVMTGLTDKAATWSRTTDMGRTGNSRCLQGKSSDWVTAEQGIVLIKAVDISIGHP